MKWRIVKSRFFWEGEWCVHPPIPMAVGAWKRFPTWQEALDYVNHQLVGAGS